MEPEAFAEYMLPQLRALGSNQNANKDTIHNACFVATEGDGPRTKAGQYKASVLDILDTNNITHVEWPAGWLNKTVLDVAKALMKQE